MAAREVSRLCTNTWKLNNSNSTFANVQLLLLARIDTRISYRLADTRILPEIVPHLSPWIVSNLNSSLKSKVLNNRFHMTWWRIHEDDGDNGMASPLSMSYLSLHTLLAYLSRHTRTVLLYKVIGLSTILVRKLIGRGRSKNEISQSLDDWITWSVITN